MDEASHVTSAAPLLEEVVPEAVEVPGVEAPEDDGAVALVPAELPLVECDAADVALLAVPEAAEDAPALLAVDDAPPEEDDAGDDVPAGFRTQRPTPPSGASHAYVKSQSSSVLQRDWNGHADANSMAAAVTRHTSAGRAFTGAIGYLQPRQARWLPTA